MVLNIKHRIAEFTSGVALLLHIQNQGGSLEKMGVRPGPWLQLPCWEETAHALGPRRGSIHGCSLFLTSLGYWFSSSPRGTTDVIFTPWCLPIFTIQSVIYDQQHQRHLGTWSECSISASTPRYRSPPPPPRPTESESPGDLYAHWSLRNTFLHHLHRRPGPFLDPHLQETELHTGRHGAGSPSPSVPGIAVHFPLTSSIY